MKKLILSVSALILSLGCANAQLTSTGAQDNFAAATELTGITWDEGDFTMTRAGDFTLKFAGTDLGGKSSAEYPSFRVTFDTPMDLSAAADVTVDVTNGSSNKLIMRVFLEDADGVQATIEPNISDVTSDLDWSEYVGTPPNQKYPRKADNGFVLAANARGTFRIDLSSVAGSVGGLTRTGWTGDNGCNVVGPYCGPVTDYLIDVENIVAVVFLVNYDDDRYMLSMGVGDGDHTDDYIIDAANQAAEVLPFTGTITLHDFKVGDATTNVATAAIEKSLAVYPNPAKEALNISFATTEGAQITLSNVVGNEVYTASANAGENKFTVNTTDLPQGLYIVNVSTEAGKVARKVMIK